MYVHYAFKNGLMSFSTLIEFGTRFNQVVVRSSYVKIDYVRLG